MELLRSRGGQEAIIGAGWQRESCELAAASSRAESRGA